MIHFVVLVETWLLRACRMVFAVLRYRNSNFSTPVLPTVYYQYQSHNQEGECFDLLSRSLNLSSKKMY